MAWGILLLSPNSPSGAADDVRGAAGLYGGAGWGVTMSNGNGPKDILGPFDTRTLDTPFGSLSVGWSGDIYQITVTVGPGLFGAISRYDTDTKEGLGGDKKPASLVPTSAATQTSPPPKPIAKRHASDSVDGTISGQACEGRLGPHKCGGSP